MEGFKGKLDLLLSCLTLFHGQLTLFISVCPPEVRSAAIKLLRQFLVWCSPYCYLDFTVTTDGVTFEDILIYHQSQRKTENPDVLALLMSIDGSFSDNFEGVAVQWEHNKEKRVYTLRMRKRDKFLNLDRYTEHILKTAISFRREPQHRSYNTPTPSGGGSSDMIGYSWVWKSFHLSRPTTFETLGMDPDMKSAITKDLTDFAEGVSRRSWNRRYLLSGSAEMSNVIVAIANFLNYDIYDLKLTEVNTVTLDLGNLLKKTTSKSIIWAEVGDVSGLNPSASRVNYTILSAILNFSEMLVGADERVFIFTANHHIESLDSTLLNRIDLHLNW